MESKYHYFKRDISWLSFNHRVLLEADDDSLPLYERINFVSIYSSNLEEFYKIRVAEHKAIASGGHSDDITQEEAKHLIHQITEVVNEQMEDRIRIYERKLIPALREQQHVVFYQSKQEVEPVHTEFIRNFFKEEIFLICSPCLYVRIASRLFCVTTVFIFRCVSSVVTPVRRNIISSNCHIAKCPVSSSFPGWVSISI